MKDWIYFALSVGAWVVAAGRIFAGGDAWSPMAVALGWMILWRLDERRRL